MWDALFPLDDGQFIALTKELHRRLEELKHFSEEKDDTLQLHQLSAHTVEELASEVNEIKVDRHWKKLIDHLKHKTKPVQVPKKLTAELRGYQREGFEWLMRLSQWGVGACLADDMGLGKTLQGFNNDFSTR